MKEVDFLIEEIRRMSIDEKIAALSQTDKAYIRGYVERVFIKNRESIQKSRIKGVEHKENK